MKICDFCKKPIYPVLTNSSDEKTGNWRVKIKRYRIPVLIDDSEWNHWRKLDICYDCAQEIGMYIRQKLNKPA